MKTNINLLTGLTCLTLAGNAVGAVHYVDLKSGRPAPPYITWATAATIIQDAIDVARPGDVVVVADGKYETGGRPVGTDVLANRVAVDKPLTVRSVNGPAVTVIQGGAATAPTYLRMRCVYLANGAVLSGFTLSNGWTGHSGDASREMSGGGVWCESTKALVTNCILTHNSAGDAGGAARGGTLNHCTLSNNYADHTGGASDCILNNCTLRQNFADQGTGGASDCVLNNCTLTGNGTDHGTGGASDCVLNNCLLSNSASPIGGARDCTLNNCTLSGNSGVGGSADVPINYWDGIGGAAGGTLNNCILTGNSGEGIGGAAGATLNNCTIARNHGRSAGGASDCTLNNCIVYYNDTRDDSGTGILDWNYAKSTLNYCCTTPLPVNGMGNIDQDPAFVDLLRDFHLQTDSPCIDAGADLRPLIFNDIEGKIRPIDGSGDGVATFDMGAYEFGTPTTSDQIEALIWEIGSSSLSQKQTQPLLASLEAALASFRRGKTTPGINQLRAFENKLRAQVAAMDPTLALQWIADVERIIQSVPGGRRGPEVLLRGSQTCP